MSKTIKTLIFNIIGICIFVKSICYLCEHNDVSFLIWIALVILASIGIYFIKKDFTVPTEEDTSRFAIFLFLYAANRKLHKIEKDDIDELALNNSIVGKVVKELVDNIIKKEINERKVTVSSKDGSYEHTYIEENNG